MNRKKVVTKIFIFVAVLLCFFKVQVFAYEPVQDQIVDGKKIWKINFNKPINNNINLQSYFKVMDSKGNEIKNSSITMDSSKKSIFLQFPYGYTYSKGETYRLYISKEIQSQENKKLPKDINMSFSIGSNSTYYVSSNVHDNGDGSIEKPFNSVGEGINRMKPGDTLIIRKGLYSGRFDINKKGNANNWFTIKAYPGERVVFDGNETGNSCFVFNKSSYLKLEGINITRYTEAGVYIRTGCDHIVLNNLKICELNNPDESSSGVEGVMGEGVTKYCTVSNCEIYNVGLKLNRQKDHGVYIGYGAEHWIFENNDIHNNSGGGIQLYGEPTGGSYCTIKNNKLYDNNYCGLRIANNAIGNEVEGNTFYGNKDTDLYINENSIGNTIKNNVFGSLNSVYNVAVEDTSYLNNNFDRNTYKKSAPNCVYTPNGSISFTDWQKKGMEPSGHYYNK